MLAAVHHQFESDDHHIFRFSFNSTETGDEKPANEIAPLAICTLGALRARFMFDKTVIFFLLLDDE